MGNDPESSKTSASGAAPGAAGSPPDSPEAGDFPDVRSLVETVIQNFTSLMRGDIRHTSLATGFQALDEITDGLSPGHLHVIAARPNGCKVMLMMNTLQEVCIGQKVPSLLFYSETSPLSFINRMVFGRAGFPLDCLDYGYKPDVDQLRSIQRASVEVAMSDLRIHQQGNLTWESIASIARKAHEQKPLGCIAIEDLHRIRPSDPGMKTKAAFAETVAGLKSLACELGVPILTTAHLRKSSWNRRSGLEDLRHASVLAYEADLVAILQPMLKENGFDLVVCSVVKNPNGRLGDFDLYLDSGMLRLSEKPVPNAEERERIRDWNEYVMEKSLEEMAAEWKEEAKYRIYCAQDHEIDFHPPSSISS